MPEDREKHTPPLPHTERGKGGARARAVLNATKQLSVCASAEGQPASDYRRSSAVDKIRQLWSSIPVPKPKGHGFELGGWQTRSILLLVEHCSTSGISHGFWYFQLKRGTLYITCTPIYRFPPIHLLYSPLWASSLHKWPVPKMVRAMYGPSSHWTVALGDP